MAPVSPWDLVVPAPQGLECSGGRRPDRGDKAYTAVGFGLATDGWHDFVKDDPPLAMGAATGIDRLIVFGGGYPIKVGDAGVGAIGVSGGHYSQDMEVAQAGLSALAAMATATGAATES